MRSTVAAVGHLSDQAGKVQRPPQELFSYSNVVSSLSVGSAMCALGCGAVCSVHFCALPVPPGNPLGPPQTMHGGSFVCWIWTLWGIS